MPCLMRRLLDLAIPQDHPMSQAQFRVFWLIYSVYALAWIIGLTLVNYAWHAPYWAKLLAVLLLVVITPTLEGPFRYRKYVERWERQQEQLRTARDGHWNEKPERES